MLCLEGEILLHHGRVLSVLGRFHLGAFTLSVMKYGAVRGRLPGRDGAGGGYAADGAKE